MKTDEPPTGDEGRVAAIDVLRGVALLGILIVNIETFAMPGIAQFNPTANGEGSWSGQLVHGLTYVFAKQKFMAIFSMLFGAGMVLLYRKHEKQGQRAARIHYARCFWLLVFGLIHMFFIWMGDILVIYAICGSILYSFRRLRPQWQLACGLLILLAPVCLNVYVNSILPNLDPGRRARLQSQWHPDKHTMAETFES